MPKPVVPPNDVAPWLKAIDELTTDREAYERESAASRVAAGQFVGSLDAGEMERYLKGLRRSANVAPEPPTIESLSPEKRALLLQRLHARRTVR